MNHSPLQAPRPGRRTLLLGAGLAAAGTAGLARTASAATVPDPGAVGTASAVPAGRTGGGQLRQVGPYAARPASAVPAAVGVAPDAALQRLKDGNDRFARGAMTHPRQDPASRAAVAQTQHPYAIVVTCLDSRVTPEFVFDQGLGDLLVVRDAAHSLDTLVVGGAEYGQADSAAPLIVVMGHQRCAEVAAAVQVLDHGADAGPHLNEVVDSLKPAYLAAKGIGATDLVESTTRENISLSVQILKADQRFQAAQNAGTLKIVGAYYSLDDGKVVWF